MSTPLSVQVLDAGMPMFYTSSRLLPGRGEPGRRDQTSSARVGVDLVAVTDVACSLERFGDRYLDRIFTPHEIACCRTGDRSPGVPRGFSVESLAARFAAKEATLKVLRPEGPRPEWRSIEVHRTSGGWCEIRLFGLAAALAVDAGIEELAVSLTHEAMMAAAVVVGMCTSGDAAGGLSVGPSSWPTWREE
jgi:holo-[acyl-carrier protein] synthase